jgi:hypothetical protein
MNARVELPATREVRPTDRSSAAAPSHADDAMVDRQAQPEGDALAMHQAVRRLPGHAKRMMLND